MWARRQQRGFTIVELLIVIVVIAILAAVTIVAYNGVQARARASEASSALTQAKKKLELYKVDNGAYPTTGNLMSAGVANGDVTFQYTSSDGSSYCITGTAGNVSYRASDTTAPTGGGCPGHGQGGVAAITNLATNPSLESDTTGWSIRWFGANGGNGTTARTSAATFSGTSGYRKTWTAAGNGQDIGYQYSLGITAGKTYTFSVYMRSSVSTKYRRWLEWYNSGGTQLSNDALGSESSIASNTWGRLSDTGTAPAGATQATFIFGPYPDNNVSFGVGDTLDADALMATEGSTLYGYADGSSSNWVWNGTTNSSTSSGPPS